MTIVQILTNLILKIILLLNQSLAQIIVVKIPIHCHNLIVVMTKVIIVKVIKKIYLVQGQYHKELLP